MNKLPISLAAAAAAAAALTAAAFEHATVVRIVNINLIDWAQSNVQQAADKIISCCCSHPHCLFIVVIVFYISTVSIVYASHIMNIGTVCP